MLDEMREEGERGKVSSVNRQLEAQNVFHKLPKVAYPI